MPDLAQIGRSRRENRARMREFGDRVVALRQGRSRVDIALTAGEAADEDLSEDWLRRLEEGTRVSMSPWEVRALADALGRTPRETEALWLEFLRIIGWVS